jgi:hypothetical protein
MVKRKIPSPLRELNPRTPTVQPVAQRYTDWAIIIIIIIIIIVVVVVVIIIILLLTCQCQNLNSTAGHSPEGSFILRAAENKFMGFDSVLSFCATDVSMLALLRKLFYRISTVGWLVEKETALNVHQQTDNENSAVFLK